MSNHLAIAAVTETLRFILNGPVAASVATASAKALRPDDAGLSGPLVNIYLYQATPNPSWRNDDLPTRSAGGTIVQRPRAALDLHYLLTFHGDDANFEPQRLLGTVAHVLHARPVLDRDTVRAAILAKPILATADLADAVELVRFTPMPLSLEELTKLWSVFLQTKYILSAAYQASVVIIEGDETPRAPLPVRERRVVVLAGFQPQLERVGVQSGTDPVLFDTPAIDDQKLHLLGTGLRGQTTRVRLGQSLFVPGDVADDRIIIDLATELPPGERTAGVKLVQVVHDVNFGTAADPHRGVESNAVPFMLSPRFTAPPSVAAGEITIDVSPPIAAGQRVVVLLNHLASPATFSFTVVPAANVSTIVIPIPGVAPAGEYLVRLQVDGATSPLIVDNVAMSPTFGQFIAPKVMV